MKGASNMEIILNKCYGGLSFSQEALERAGFNWENDRYNDDLRHSLRMIDVVREMGDAAGEYYSKPVVITIPEEATDYKLMSQDGFETILYVVNGKIHQI